MKSVSKNIKNKSNLNLEGFLDAQVLLKEERNKKIEKILWIDLEMTGLNVEEDKVLQIAAIATDLDFNHLGKIDIVVKHSQKVLKNMSDWCKITFSENKLIDKIKKSEVNTKQAEEKFLKFIDKHFKQDNYIIIAGNTIHQDRKFIDKYFKKIASRLHYRMIDVSSFKIIFKNKYNLSMNRDKEAKHLALDDVKQSILEMEFYSQHINITNK